MKRLWNLLRRFVYERRRFLFYGAKAVQGKGIEDPDVNVYDAWEDIPLRFRRVVTISPCLDVMVHRLRRGRVRLLCLSKNGQSLLAYGWIQDGRLFRSRFGALAGDGTMLGPYWTAPEKRGRGLYGRLLLHSLALCPRDRRVLIYTSPENRASQRGIEKAGFHFLGEWELQACLRVFVRFRQVDGASR